MFSEKGMSGPCLMLVINMFPDPMDTMGFISSPKTGVMAQLTALSHKNHKMHIQAKA